MSPLPGQTGWQKLFFQCGWGVAALLVISIFLQDRNPPPKEQPNPETNATFANLAKAQFFGELTPATNSNPAPGKNYTLLAGMVELAFPDGASAIIEAPALFRVVSDDRLALDVGQCSVHCPPRAEGFQVDTPFSKVVDRGTRFFVNVSESSETEVQVIEGAADISTDAGGETFRLVDGEARKVGTQGVAASKFSPSGYRQQLPDRIISYQATKDSEGRAMDLLSVKVQRGGRTVDYPVKDLVPTELTSFRPWTGAKGMSIC